MGNDLVSACVFCLGMLFGVDFTPPAGYSAEVFAGFGALQRQVKSGSALVDDRSDTALKAAGIGMRWTRPAATGLGAGTPASEIRLRFAFPNSHDEVSQSTSSPAEVAATGDGR